MARSIRNRTPKTTEVMETTVKSMEESKLCIIGIGASAGGLEALQDFFSHLPPIENASIVVAQHLSPTHKSMLVQLLSRQTSLVVSEAIHGKKLEPNKIYITPPDKDISIINEQIYLSKPSAPFGPKPSVDVLFKSLTENKHANIIGIILSGTGTDGAQGIKSLKETGALTLVQEPSTAKYDGMPQAAIQAIEVDIIIAPNKMGIEIANYLQYPESIHLRNKHIGKSPNSLDKIFQLLSKKTGTDFSNYKSATIFRRLEKRIEQLKVQTIEEYLAVIENDPKEADEMFNMILIGVTTFFRDTEAFNALEKILSNLLSTKKPGDSIRIWAPGCSTGEEPYSIAILLSQLLKENLHHYKIQIFATDIDDRAIQFARRGIYSFASIESIPDFIKDSYFIKKEKEFELVKNIRSMVLFSKHDLTKNPPFLKLDLISCRNLLIYFNAALQQHIIPIFHYSLQTEGYLFLGKSETVSAFTDLFGTVDAKNKIYIRKRGSNLHSIKFSAFKAETNFNQEEKTSSAKIKTNSVTDLVKETLFNTFEHPYVLVDDHLDIQEIFGDVRLFITLNSGSMQINLVKMVNQELQIELRTLLSKVIKNKINYRSEIKKFELFSGTYYVRIHARPLLFNEAKENLYMVIFEKLDINEFISKGTIEGSEDVVSEKLTELEQELNATKEHLQTYIEEIETSNEELQSLNEELQSTNEELQSSNEELETSNEELQSTNEEIQIAYAELKSANEELERKELILQTLQANSNAMLNIELHGLILIDTLYKIIQFNQQASIVFGKLNGAHLNTEQTIIELFPRAYLEEFIDNLTQATKGEIYKAEKEFKTKNGQSYWFEVNYIPAIYEGNVIKSIALAFKDITDRHVLFDAMKRTEDLFKNNELLMLEAQKVAKMGSWNFDIRTDKLNWSEPLYEVFGVEKSNFIETHGYFTSLVDEKDKAMVAATNTKAQETGEPFNIIYRITTPNGEKRVIEEFGFSEKDEQGKVIRLFGTIQNITERNNKEEMLRLFENVIKYSHDAVNISKTKNDNDLAPHIIYVNEAFEQLFGYPAQEVIDTDNTQFFGPKSDQTELYKLSENFKNKLPAEATVICYKKNGETFWNHISGSPVFSNEGELIYWISIQRDVTEIQSKNQQKKLLSDINKIFGRHPLNDALKFTIQKLLEYSDCICTELWLVNKYQTRINHHITAILNGLDTQFSEETKTPKSFEINQGLPGKVWFKKEMEVTNFENLSEDEILKLGIYIKLGIKSVISYPILLNNEVVGVLIYKSDKAFHSFNIMHSFLMETAKFLGNEISRKKTEEENNRILDAAADIICMASFEGYFLKINKAATEILGYSEAELLSKPYHEFIHPDDTFKTLEINDTLINGKPTQYFENRFITKSGQIVWLAWSATPIPEERIQFGVAKNITQQKEADKKLRESLQSLSDYKAALEQSFNMVLTDTEGYIVDVNDATTKLSGYSRAELIGSHTRVNRSGHHPQSYYTQMWETIIKGNIWRGEIHNKRKDGSYYWVDTIIVPLKNADGDIINYMAIRTDISERKFNEENLKVLNKNLTKQAHELSLSNTSLEQFAVVASRDLQEPLRMVSSFLSQLKKKYGLNLDEKGNQYIDFAAAGAKDMREIMLDLLEFSKVGSIVESAVWFDPNLLIEEVKLFEKKGIEESHAKITCEKLPLVNGFKDCVKKILQELIHNAIKFKKPSEIPMITISGVEYEDKWIFAVNDNGIGIEEESFEKIFIIFQKLHSKDTYPGTGMGLAIVKKLVETIGGNVWVTSIPDKGSTFNFSIPKVI